MKAVKADNKSQIAFLQAMLSQVRLDDPNVKLFIEERINNKRKNGSQKEISGEIIRRLRIQNKKLMEQVASLKARIKQSGMDQEQISIRLSELLKLNKSLSDGLGSCTICWGEDAVCDNCSGRGSPGWRKINRRSFNIYVLPTLEKLYGLSKTIK
jgi:hypothetical protein